MKRLMVLGLALGMLVALSWQANAANIYITFIEQPNEGGIKVFKNGTEVGSTTGEHIGYNLTASEFNSYYPPMYYDFLENDGSVSDRVLFNFTMTNGANLIFGSDPDIPAVGTAAFIGSAQETGGLQWVGGDGFGLYSTLTGNFLYVGMQSDVDAAPVPEPGTMMLLGSGLVGLARYGRKRFKK